MSSENARLLFKSAQEGQQRLEYFVTGVIGAMFAYIAQTYTPRQIDGSSHTLEAVAILYLAIAFLLGMRRIEILVKVHSANHKMIDSSEKAGYLSEAIAEGRIHALNRATGEEMTQVDMIARRLEYMNASQQSKALLDRLNKLATQTYFYRNILLIAGVASLVLSKFLQPYSQTQ